MYMDITKLVVNEDYIVWGCYFVAYVKQFKNIRKLQYIFSRLASV